MSKAILTSIQVDPCPIGGFMAIDVDRYDGAPDGDMTVGYGDTEQEAIDDLLEQYDDQA